MPHVHDLQTRVQGRRVRSRFYTRKVESLNGVLDIPIYNQCDSHSCSFLAALAVAKYLNPGICNGQVLRAVAPTRDGCGWRNVVRALTHFGIKADYWEDMDLPALRQLMIEKVPVIVTIYPDGYESDHWTVIRGVRGRRIYLTNYEEESVTWSEFLDMWSPKGVGWVCHVNRTV